MDDAIVWGLVISAGLALIAALQVLWTVQTVTSDRGA